jgi:hypothetical protein
MPDDPFEDTRLITDLIAAASWRETTYIAPHAYVLHRAEPELYALVRTLLETQGYQASFQGKAYRYVDVGDHTYWIVGHVLNRRRLAPPPS